MSHFSEKETEYLRGQRLGRLATIGSDGAPHVVPVGFRLGADGEAIEVGGHGMGASKKWRDLQTNPRIALVVDDLQSVNPFRVRGPLDRREYVSVQAGRLQASGGVSSAFASSGRSLRARAGLRLTAQPTRRAM